MFARKKPDVLVVGAGPVGLFTALALTERGARVQIVDKEWRTGTRSYALGLHAESLRLLEELGVLGGVLERARRIRRVGLYDGADRRAEMRINDLAEDHSFVAVMRQEDLETLLADALAKRGVKVTWNHQVPRVVPHPDHVEVTIEKLSKDSMGYAVQHTEWVVSKARELEVPFVIGCDGHHSAVRRAIGLEYPEVNPATEFAVFEFKTDADLGDEMRVVMDAETSNVCWPLPDGFCRWSFQKPPENPESDTREKDRELFQVSDALFPILEEGRLQEFLAERAPWFHGSIEGIRWRMVVRFENRLTSSLGGGRAWILGDAAHLAGPVGIQSMNVGLREARDLADLIARGAEPGALQAYDEACLREWRALLGLDDVVSTTAETDPWIAARKDRIVSCVPASGANFDRLAGQLGLKSSMPVRGG